jgi:hypothetical protein
MAKLKRYTSGHEFLLDIINDPDADEKQKVKAALALFRIEEGGRYEPPGVKELRADRAKRLGVGRFATPPVPKALKKKH